MEVSIRYGPQGKTIFNRDTYEAFRFNVVAKLVLDVGTTVGFLERRGEQTKQLAESLLLLPQYLQCRL